MVQENELFLPFLFDKSGNPIVVVIFSIPAYCPVKVREAIEDATRSMEVFFLKTISAAIIQGHVCPLGHLLVDDIVIAYGLRASLGPHHLVWVRSNTTESFGESDADEALHDEVHLVYLLELFVYYSVLAVWLEAPGHQTLSYHVEQAFVRGRAPRVIGSFEEAGELSYDVFE